MCAFIFQKYVFIKLFKLLEYSPLVLIFIFILSHIYRSINHLHNKLSVVFIFRENDLFFMCIFSVLNMQAITNLDLICPDEVILLIVSSIHISYYLLHPRSAPRNRCLRVVVSKIYQDVSQDLLRIYHQTIF